MPCWVKNMTLKSVCEQVQGSEEEEECESWEQRGNKLCLCTANNSQPFVLCNHSMKNRFTSERCWSKHRFPAFQVPVKMVFSGKSSHFEYIETVELSN